MWLALKGLESDGKLNTKPSLGDSFARAGRMMSPIPFPIDEPARKPNEHLANTLAVSSDVINTVVRRLKMAAPLIDEFGKTAATIGHLDSPPDVAGVIRTEPW